MMLHKGIFVGVRLRNPGKSKLLCSLIGAPFAVQPEKELHCTVMYSLAAIEDRVAIMGASPTLTHMATISSIEIFGPSSDYIVATLECDTLKERHEYWRKLGCVPTFNPYTPHISIGKGQLHRNSKQLQRLKDSIVGLHIELSGEYWEELRE